MSVSFQNFEQFKRDVGHDQHLMMSALGLVEAHQKATERVWFGSRRAFFRSLVLFLLSPATLRKMILTERRGIVQEMESRAVKDEAKAQAVPKIQVVRPDMNGGLHLVKH